jgi:hypothetical protein
MEKSEYTMVEFASVSTRKPIDKLDNGTTNMLPGKEEPITTNLDDLESYEPTEKIEFEAAAVKDCLEKKKKKRNYIEFRPDYVTA